LRYNVTVASKRQPHPVFSKDPERARRVSEVLKAVAHPLRIRIVAILAEGDENVTALSEKLEAPQAIVSQQLRILRSQGLVDAVREAGFARYRLVETNLRTLVTCMENCGR